MLDINAVFLTCGPGRCLANCGDGTTSVGGVEDPFGTFETAGLCNVDATPDVCPRLWTQNQRPACDPTTCAPGVCSNDICLLNCGGAATPQCPVEFVCPEDAPCQVECNNGDECVKELFCPSSAPCSLDCRNNGCENVTQHCEAGDCFCDTRGNVVTGRACQVRVQDQCVIVP